MPSPLHPAANCGSFVVTLANSAWARSRSAREPVRTMNELSSARACRYSSLTGPGSEPSCGRTRAAHQSGRARRSPCSAANTSFEISVCTAIKSSDATRIAPPERTLCEPTSSSCQFRSKPCSERRKLPASTNETSIFCPTDKRIHLRDRHRHQRARRPHHERRECAPAARQSRRPAHSHKAAQPLSHRDSQTAAPPANSAARARSADSRKRSASIERNPVARFSASAPGRGQVGRCVAGNDAGLDLQRLHDRLQRLAHFGRCAITRAGFFSRHVAITLFSSVEIPGTISLRSAGSEN